MIKRLLICAALMLCGSIAAHATTISIPSTTVPNWRRTTTAPVLRAYYDQTFTDSAGTIVQGGNPQQGTAYLSVTTSILSNTVTIPAFTITSTRDGLDRTSARISFYWYSSTGQLLQPFEPYTGLAVPASIGSATGCSPSGTCCSLAELKNFQTGIPPYPPTLFYSTTEIDRLLGNFSALSLSLTDDVSSVTSYASISAAVTAIGAATKTLVIPNVQTVSANVTIPSNITLRFTGSGRIDVANTYTLTVNGPIDAPSQRKIFGALGSSQSQGTVVIGTMVNALYPEWWGAVGNQTTDDTAALQATLNAAKDNTSLRGKTVILQSGQSSFGTYLVTSTLTIDDVTGLQVIGRGTNARLQWGGAGTGPVLKITDTIDSLFDDFMIFVPTSYSVTNAVWMYTSTTRTFVSRHNLFRNITITSTLNQLANGFRVGATAAEGGADANNDFHRFDHCQVSNYTGHGWSLENTQIYGVLFTGCIATGNSTSLAQAAVRTDQGTGSTGGAFSWIGGGIGGLQDSAFIMGTPNGQPIVIQDVDIENATSPSAGGIFRSLGPTGAINPVVIENVSYRSGIVTPDPNNVLNFQGPGPIIVKNCNIGNNTAVPLRIRWNPGGGTDDRSFSIINTHLKTSNTAITTAFNGPLPTLIEAMTLESGAGLTLIGGVQTRSIIQDPAIVGRSIRAASAQTANLMQFENTGGTVVTSFDEAGKLRLNSATQATDTLEAVGNARVTGKISVGADATPTEAAEITGNLALMVAGNGLKIKEGSNATMGVAALAAGTVTVSTTKVTANSRIFLTMQDSASTGVLRVSARVVGTSFTITSTNAGDTSNVAWMIVEPN